ncbi:cell death abnormality protein 1-like isoform X2 [Magallana gigas]|uniref:cell death abnormality protein 1-like isoform X2 n=1 Tax=Magallana gigas TaxID=29159 RepID=UPI003342576A
MNEIMNSQIFINVLLPGYFQVSLTESAVCVNNLTKQRNCCTDYRNISGRCEACIGLWGKDCVNRCADGFYGLGCRHKCHCNEQLPICDSKLGCTNRSDTGAMEGISNTTVLAVFLLLTCFLVFLLIGTVLYFYQLQKNREKPSVTTCASSNHLKDQTEDAIYNDIRESHFIDSRFVATTNNSSTCFSKDYKQIQGMISKSSKQDMSTPTDSRVLSPTEYESCFKESEGYSRLGLKSHVRSSVLRKNYE